MGITVKEALRIGGLKEGEVIAGRGGLDNLITSVSVIEIPEAVDWYRGNELQITALYSVANDVQAQIQLIRNLANYKCAALVICHSDYWLKRIPSEVMELADKLNFPLIKVPSSIAYIDIITPVMGEILQRQNRKLQLAVEIHNSMTRLILAGKEAQELVTVLSDMIKKPVMLFDSNNKRIAEKQGVLTDQQAVLLENAIENCLEPLINRKKIHKAMIPDLCDIEFIFSPIISGSTYYGLLVLAVTRGENKLDDMDLIALEHAGTAFALLSLRKKSVQEIQDRMQRDFMEDLITWNFKNEDVALNRANGLGWNLLSKKVIMVINIDGFTDYKIKKNPSEQELFLLKDKFCRVVKDYVLTENYGNIVVNRSDSIVVLLDCKQESMEETKTYARATKLGIGIIEICRRINLSVSVGVSSFLQETKDISRGFQEARDALEIGKMVYGARSCTLFSELGIYPILKELVRDNNIMEVVSNYCTLLDEFDKENNTELAETFRNLIDYDQNTKKVAQKMHVHKNTVLYRKKQIINVLGYNPFQRPFKAGLTIIRELEKLGECKY